MGEDPSHIDPDFGLSLAVLRVGRGWSQADLAKGLRRARQLGLSI